MSYAVFGVSLVILYAASTLYHVMPQGAKRFFRVVDHAAIYLLIAGTYTPFVLVNLRGVWGWSLFGVVWGCAVLGIVLKGVCFARFEKASVAVYVGMGMALSGGGQADRDAGAGTGVWLLLGGGIAYTSGVVFYAWRRLPYSHAIWHVWVLCGSTLHFFSVITTLGGRRGGIVR